MDINIANNVESVMVEQHPFWKARLISSLTELNSRLGNKISDVKVIITSLNGSVAEAYKGYAVGKCPLKDDPGQPGHVKMWLDPDAWEIHKDYDTGFLMPSFHTVDDNLLYRLAHELGHAFDTQDLSWLKWRAFRKYLGQYGRKTRLEGFAEFFAEWYVTSGTTENTGAQLMAKTYGWEV